MVKKKVTKKVKKTKAKKAKVEKPIEEEIVEQAEDAGGMSLGAAAVIKGKGAGADSLREMKKEESESAKLLKELEDRDTSRSNVAIATGRAPLTRWDYRFEIHTRIGRKSVALSMEEAEKLKRNGERVFPVIAHGPENGPTQVFLPVEGIAQADEAIRCVDAIIAWHEEYGNERWSFSPGEIINERLEVLRKQFDLGERGPHDWSLTVGRVPTDVHEWRAILITRDRTRVTLDEAKEIGVAVYTALAYGLETQMGYDVRVENKQAAEVLKGMLEQIKNYLGE